MCRQHHHTLAFLRHAESQASSRPAESESAFEQGPRCYPHTLQLKRHSYPLACLPDPTGPFCPSSSSYSLPAVLTSSSRSLYLHPRPSPAPGRNPYGSKSPHRAVCSASAQPASLSPSSPPLLHSQGSLCPRHVHEQISQRKRPAGGWAVTAQPSVL